MEPVKKQSSKKISLTGIALLIGVLALLGLNLFDRFRPALAIKNNRYQSVVTESNDIYFGKVTSLGKRYVVLKDAAYLSGGEEQGLPGGTYRLMRTKNRLHQPENKAVFVRETVTIIENLSPDSPISQGMKQLINEGKDSVEVSL